MQRDNGLMRGKGGSMHLTSVEHGVMGSYAIVGAHRHMHTVLVELCTGCELCVAPCPVDCIVMVPRAQLRGAAGAPTAAENRARFHAHGERLAAQAAERAALLSDRKRAARTAE